MQMMQVANDKACLLIKIKESYIIISNLHHLRSPFF
jgi:hypothetical protein